jgi:hypothetical protein
MNEQRSRLAAMEIPASADAATRATLKDAVADSFVAGFRRVMLISAVLALLSAACAALTLGARVKRAT